MKALVSKDFMVLKKVFKIWGVVGVFALTLITKGAYSFLPLLMASSVAGSTILYDERCKWTEYSYMLPYSRFELVVSKYLVSYISIAAVAVIKVVISLLNNLMLSTNMTIYAGFDRLILEIALMLIFISISLWTQFKYGYQKSRFINIIFIIVLSVTNPFTNDVAMVIEGKIMNAYDFLATIIFVLAIICNLISIKCSMSIKKE